MLVDFDLRNPTQSKNFDLADKKGKNLRLTNTILTMYSQVDGLKLDILCASNVEETATEILADQEIYSILGSRHSYIEQPPFLCVIDRTVALNNK